MKNRAKCKLCNTIIESFHSTDYVMCKCGEIALDGGAAMNCFARTWENLIRVDDNGHEVQVKVQKDTIKLNISLETRAKPSKAELFNMFVELVKTYESLPQQAMSLPISHYDLLSVLLILQAILRSDEAS